MRLIALFVILLFSYGIAGQWDFEEEVNINNDPWNLEEVLR